MDTKPITIHVNAEAAQHFERVPEEQRRKIEVLLSLKLSEVTRPGQSLEELMDEISQKAQQRGLTPEILESILHDE